MAHPLEPSSTRPLKARVHNGRLFLDEPTNLPEGKEVEVVVVNDEPPDPEECARLLRAIEDVADEIVRVRLDARELANREPRSRCAPRQRREDGAARRR